MSVPLFNPLMSMGFGPTPGADAAVAAKPVALRRGFDPDGVIAALMPGAPMPVSDILHPARPVPSPTQGTRGQVLHPGLSLESGTVIATVHTRAMPPGVQDEGPVMRGKILPDIGQMLPQAVRHKAPSREANATVQTVERGVEPRVIVPAEATRSVLSMPTPAQPALNPPAVPSPVPPQGADPTRMRPRPPGSPETRAASVQPQVARASTIPKPETPLPIDPRPALEVETARPGGPDTPDGAENALRVVRTAPWMAGVTGDSMAIPRATAPSAPAPITVPITDTHAWQQQLSDRMGALIRMGTETATIRLEPAKLGPIEIRIHVDDAQASVSFSAQHPATREALEAALPRLRDAFEAQGLELSRADVSGDSAGNRTRDHARSDVAPWRPQVSESDPAPTDTVRLPRHDSQIDLYA